MILDYNFFYKEIIRMVLINKFFVMKLNNSLVGDIYKLLFFFCLTKLEDIYAVEIYNYFYLFKYFFGRRAFLTRIKSFFHLGE